MTIQLPEKLLTGIKGIDDQHRALIHWARTVNSMGAVNGDRAIVLRAAQFLIAYAKYHFDSEEYAMVASGYESIAVHRHEHAMMRRELSELRKSINNREHSAEATVELLQELIRRWIQNHISAADLAFARYCEQEPETRTIKLPSPRELRKAGLKVTDYEQVEAVHHAGEITPGELKARLIVRK